MKLSDDIDANTVRRVFEDCCFLARDFMEGLTIETKMQYPGLGRFDVQYEVVTRIRSIDRRAFDYMRRRASATPRHDRGRPGQLEQIKGRTANLNPWLEQTGQNFHASM
jgi:hypothetical protein